MNDTTPELTQALSIFLRALVDTERLQIAGLLARKPHSAEQLAAQLGLKPAVLARQLEKLAEAGLVRSETKGNHTRYRLQLESARTLAARLAPRPAAPALDENIAEADRQVLRNYLSADGTLKELPMQAKKLLVILRYVRDRIEPGRRYTEKQLNERLARFHTDVASLRRYLVDFKFMQRTATGSEYWREA
jgi:DNA-binding HxlR family transcriptional regulator